MPETETKGLEIREGRTEIIAPYRDSTRTFVYPRVGPTTYFENRRLLKEQGLQMPSASETIALVLGAQQNPAGKYEREILDILRNKWLWMNHGILYTPKTAENHGAYIVENPEISDGAISLNERELLERLEQDDPTVCFVPFGYKIGNQSAKELERNPFIRALFKDEAELVGEVAANFRYWPYLWSFEDVEQEETRLACLGSGLGAYSLLVSGDTDFGDGLSFAFGVDENSGEANEIEK